MHDSVWLHAVKACDPNELFPGRVLVVAPHMDDEVIGCGHTLARLAAAGDAHVVFATDGSESPKPPPLSNLSRRPDLVRIREAEAIRAAAVLGLSDDRVHFLRLPDGRLSRCSAELHAMMSKLVEKLAPDHLLVPFRKDRHPDHLELNRVCRRIVEESATRVTVTEYFVYYRWKLLPRKDVRAYVRPSLLARVDPTDGGKQKRRALRCHESQVTRYFPWQQRPTLSVELVEQVCTEPEVFFRASPTRGVDDEVFRTAPALIGAAHYLEPRLKRTLDAARAILGRVGTHRAGR